jgi:hypothetical protein
MDEELRTELLRRMEQDQQARLSDDLESGAFATVDAENLPWLKNLIHSRGWPGASLVGTDGAHAAWLLVQHAAGGGGPGTDRGLPGPLHRAVRGGQDQVPAVRDLGALRAAGDQRMAHHYLRRLRSRDADYWFADLSLESSRG